MKKKKTRHTGDEGTVAFWLYMKALYKDEEQESEKETIKMNNFLNRDMK